MPKRKSTTAATADTYDSDNGFVEDDDENGSRKKKVKSGNGAKKGGDGDGDLFWEVGFSGLFRGESGVRDWAGADAGLQLTSKRRVGISEFKGKCMVNIREYYEKDGEVLPGKKVGGFFVFNFNFVLFYVFRTILWVVFQRRCLFVMVRVCA